MMKMKKTTKVIIASFVVMLVPILVGLLLWHQLPVHIPSHWSNGRIDGWSSKNMAVFGLPLIMAAVQLFLVVATKIDALHKNLTTQILTVVYWLVPLTSTIMFILIYSTALGRPINDNVIMNLTLGIVFLVLGNYMPKVKQNSTVGFRVSWTRNSQENWRRTNRLGGWLMVLGGVFLLGNMIFQFQWLWILVLAVIVVVPLSYSYSLYRQGI